MKIADANKIYQIDLPIHNWYRFVLSFPPHLVRKYIQEFCLEKNSLIFDPFCGTGTTLVEAKKRCINSIGFEAMPIVKFCAENKLNWNIDIEKVQDDVSKILEIANILNKNNKKLLTFDAEREKLLIKISISPLPLHKTLILLKAIDLYNTDFKNFLKLALVKQLVCSFSNLKFGPEVGVSSKKVSDINVLHFWKIQINTMINDIKKYKNTNATSIVYLADSRSDLHILNDNSIDIVITSPPYPNEKDYTRTRRLESVILGFIKSRDELQSIKRHLVRSNSRNIYKDDKDYEWVKDNIAVNSLADQIEEERIRLNKTSGFEKQYHKIVRQFFGGMAKHLTMLRSKLKKGARLAYVLGDQCSYFRIPIRTGKIFSDIAQEIGYTYVRTNLFRTRLATATQQRINEEVIILEN